MLWTNGHSQSKCHSFGCVRASVYIYYWMNFHFLLLSWTKQHKDSISIQVYRIIIKLLFYGMRHMLCWESVCGNRTHITNVNCNRWTHEEQKTNNNLFERDMLQYIRIRLGCETDAHVFTTLCMWIFLPFMYHYLRVIGVRPRSNGGTHCVLSALYILFFPFVTHSS